MADEAADKKISFFHGSEANIAAKIADNTIGTNDIIISTEDNIIYVDDDKVTHTLGSAKSKEAYTVELGTGGTVGGLKTGDVIDAGTNLDELIKKIVMKRIPATYTAPSVTIATSKAAGNYEVGTNITTTFTARYVQNDGGALESIAIVDENNNNILEGTSSPLAAEDHVFQIDESTKSFRSSATYAQGAVKKDNLGDDSPSGQIAAGTRFSTSVAFTGKRNVFYGAGSGTLPEVTSDFVRGLSGKKLGPTKGSTFTINIAQGQQYSIFAIPTAIGSTPKVKYEESNDPGAASKFTKSTLVVEGANGFVGASYDVYTYPMDVPAAAGMTFTVTI